MRARIVTAIALLSIAGLGWGPAAAEDCSVPDKLLEQCPPPPPPPPPTPEPEAEPEPESQPQVQPGHQPQAVSRLLALLNGERSSRGLPPFALRDDVSVQSRRHSEAMAARGTIWHNDVFFTAANKKALGAALLGENVARNVDIDDAHRRLMNSPGHRANILDRRFTVMGLGVYRSATGSLYVTESFLQPVAPARVRAAERPRAPVAAPAPAAPTTTTTAPPAEPVPAPAAAEPVVLAAAPLSGALATPMALGAGSGEGGSILTQVLLAILLLAVAVGSVVARLRPRLLAPLLSRIGR